MTNKSFSIYTLVVLFMFSSTCVVGSKSMKGLHIYMLCPEDASPPKTGKKFLPYSFIDNGKTHYQNVCLLTRDVVFGIDLKSAEYEKYASEKVTKADLKKTFGLPANSPEDHKPYTELRLNLEFNEKGTKDLEALTRKSYRKRIAVVINGEIKSLAVVVQPILDGKVTITVIDEDHAKNIVKDLKSNYGL